MWCSVSLFNSVVSISISRFFQSGFSLISGIISSLLCSNCSSPFQERKKIKSGGTSYRINFCLDFCLSVPADWIIFYYYYCYVTEFTSCVNLKPLLIRLWLITYLKKTKLVCCALSGRLCSRKCIKWFLFNCEQTFLLSFHFNSFLIWAASFHHLNILNFSGRSWKEEGVISIISVLLYLDLAGLRLTECIIDVWR